MKSKALTLFGQYLSESYSENRLKIIADYFLKSISEMKNLERSPEDTSARVDTYDKLACFADREYQQVIRNSLSYSFKMILVVLFYLILQVKTYMKSDLFQKKVVNMEKARKAAHDIRNQRKRTDDESKAAAIHIRQSTIDENEILTAKQESNQFLQIALKFVKVKSKLFL